MVHNHVCFNNFRKNNQRNKTKILSRKCNSVMKDGKSQELSEVPPERSFIKSEVLSCKNHVDCTKNWACFTNLK